MRLASFSAAGRASWGVVRGEALADLGPSGAAVAATLRDGLRNGRLSDLDPAVIDAARCVRLSEVILQPVIPEPGKIICVGVNYHDHRAEAKRAPSSAPTIFTRFADTQVAHEAEVQYPSVSQALDYEGELAVVIAAPLWRATAAEAATHVAGYSVYNDFTARDWQRASSQWIPGKNFPGTGAFGPFLVTPDEVGDVTALRLETLVNGEVRQSASVGDLIFDIPTLLEYVSAFTPLSAGDVIVTGTPGGVGMFMNPPRLLEPGDVVEVSITGLGTLRNTVSAPAGPPSPVRVAAVTG